MLRPIRFTSLMVMMTLIVTGCFPIITHITNDCSVVTIDYYVADFVDGFPISDLQLSQAELAGIAASADEFRFQVIRTSDGAVVGEAAGPASPLGASFTVTIPLNRSYSSGTEFYVVSWTYDSGSATWLPAGSTDGQACNIPIELTWQNDGRLNWFRGFGDRIILYTARYEGGGVGLHIYNVEEDSEGRLLLRITPSMISGTPPGPENILILETRDMYNFLVSVYRLSTGELQINYGPDQEGKVFVFILKDPASLNILDEYYTFNVYDILGD